MSHSLRGLLVFMSLSVFAGFSLGDNEAPKKESADTKSKDDVFDHDRLCVTIWPAKTQVAVSEEFEVKLRVVNSSQEMQSIKVMSCSWNTHWTWSNDRLTYTPWECFRNGLMEVRLQPGEAYEKSLTLKLAGKGPSKTETLRMGFKPVGEMKTYWSNEVVLSAK